MNKCHLTEAKIVVVAADNMVRSIVWTKLYPLKENILYKDNKNAILLEINGW
jgi:hypothetical protein